MSGLENQGEITGISLLQHTMSNWMWMLKIEYKCWREQDEQAYQQITKLIKTASEEEEEETASKQRDKYSGNREDA